jgi:predicted kinase
MKILYILRGLPGAGKSTLAASLTDEHYEADMFFQLLGGYKFDASKLGSAHEWCQDMVMLAMVRREPKIAVSNTFTTSKEMQIYYDLAALYGYQVYSIIVENRHGTSEETNIHNVPTETIQKMKDRFEIKLG